MKVLINVLIGNLMDDSNRNELFIYDSDDTNVNTYLTEIINLHTDLDKYTEEFILSINEIKPKNISSDVVCNNNVIEFLNQIK